MHFIHWGEYILRWHAEELCFGTCECHAFQFRDDQLERNDRPERRCFYCTFVPDPAVLAWPLCFPSYCHLPMSSWLGERFHFKRWTVLYVCHQILDNFESRCKIPENLRSVEINDIFELNSIFSNRYGVYYAVFELALRQNHFPADLPIVHNSRNCLKWDLNFLLDWTREKRLDLWFGAENRE